MSNIEFPYDNHGKWKYYAITYGHSPLHERNVYEVRNKQTDIIEHQDSVLFVALEAAEHLDTKLSQALLKHGMSSNTSNLLELKH